MSYKEALTKQFKIQITNAMKSCKYKVYKALYRGEKLPRGIISDSARRISVEASLSYHFCYTKPNPPPTT